MSCACSGLCRKPRHHVGTQRIRFQHQSIAAVTGDLARQAVHTADIEFDHVTPTSGEQASVDGPAGAPQGSRMPVGHPYPGQPPGLPAGRTVALRAAFDAMMADKGVLAEAERQHLEINQPMPGAEIAALVERLHTLPEPIVERAIAATQRRE